MATTGELSPRGLGPMDQIAPIAEGGHERDWEPVTGRFPDSSLLLHVARQMRQSVALRVPALVGNRFITAGEGDRLEREQGNLPGIVQRKFDHATDLLIVHAVDDCDYGHDVDSGVVKVFDRAQLHVEEVAHAAVRVGGVPDAVELQIGIAQARLGGGLRKLRILGEFDAVRSGLHTVVTNFPRVSYRVQKVRRDRRLASRKLHRHLSLWFDGDGVIENLLNPCQTQLMHEAHLVGIHEARIAHHVATIRQVNC